MTKANKSKPINLKKLGLWGTAIYFIAIVFGIWVSKSNEWLVLDPISLNELGDLLAGLFGPLVIFWVVLGFFQQGDELKHSVEALNLQAEELKNSVEQQRLMVGITEKQLDLDIEVRQEQIHTTLSNELPLIKIEHISTEHMSPQGRWHIAKYKMTNFGADASHMSMFSNDRDLSLEFQQGISLVGGNSKEFEIRAQTSQKTNITVEASNTKSKFRTQVFQIYEKNVFETRCDPPLP